MPSHDHSPDSDFIDFLIVKGHEALDNKRQRVHLVSYDVDAGAFEEEVHARSGGTPIDSFHDALGFELFHDPHFVVDVGSERVRLGDGTFRESPRPGLAVPTRPSLPWTARWPSTPRAGRAGTWPGSAAASADSASGAG
jgi:hypothetical protein